MFFLAGDKDGGAKWERRERLTFPPPILTVVRVNLRRGVRERLVGSCARAGDVA